MFKAETKNVELKAIVSPDFPKYIVTDENRLKQILINLISNSVKYTKQGSVKVEAKADNRLIKLTVRDTGVGIESDRLENLFTAFTKIMRHRELNTQGVGLGLTICKNLAGALGGDISVTSTVGLGSEFMVTLPLKLPPRAAV